MDLGREIDIEPHDFRSFKPTDTIYNEIALEGFAAPPFGSLDTRLTGALAPLCRQQRRPRSLEMVHRFSRSHFLRFSLGVRPTILVCASSEPARAPFLFRAQRILQPQILVHLAESSKVW